VLALCGTCAIADAQQLVSFDDGVISPASLQRIKMALARAPAAPLDLGRPATPVFRVRVTERDRTFDPPPLDFWSGPVPPGGLNAYEQAQRICPQLSPPLISIDVLPFARGFAHAIGEARRTHAVGNAQADVRRALAEYCAAQPDGGAGIQICAISPAIR